MSLYRGDPFAPVVSQFPMTSPRCAAVATIGEAPTKSSVAPWGLRWLRPAPAMIPPAYAYCPERQVAIGAGGGLWMNEDGKEWSSIAERDGDEGTAEDYGWDTDGDVS